MGLDLVPMSNPELAQIDTACKKAMKWHVPFLADDILYGASWAQGKGHRMGSGWRLLEDMRGPSGQSLMLTGSQYRQYSQRPNSFGRALLGPLCSHHLFLGVCSGHSRPYPYGAVELLPSPIGRIHLVGTTDDGFRIDPTATSPAMVK
jgi:hypothetical protein